MQWKKWLIGSWSWKRPFYSLAAIYLLLALVGCFMADHLIFQPPGTPYPEDRRGFRVLGEGAEAVAIFHLAAGPGRPTLLWSHGNAQNLESLKPAMEYFHLRGFGVLSYDYPGYGESGGEPNEKGCYRAIETAYRHLRDEIGVPSSDIVLVGQSVGSGPTCWLAAPGGTCRHGADLAFPERLPQRDADPPSPLRPVPQCPVHSEDDLAPARHSWRRRSGDSPVQRAAALRTLSLRRQNLSPDPRSRSQRPLSPGPIQSPDSHPRFVARAPRRGGAVSLTIAGPSLFPLGMSNQEWRILDSGAIPLPDRQNGSRGNRGQRRGHQKRTQRETGQRHWHNGLGIH